MEADFVSRLDALEVKFAAQIEKAATKRALEMEELEREQDQNARRTEAKIQEAIAAVQFGVVLAPGDDIAAAVKAMAAEGGKMFLKRGVHEISETLVVDKSITFVGEGKRMRELDASFGCTCLLLVWVQFSHISRYPPRPHTPTPTPTPTHSCGLLATSCGRPRDCASQRWRWRCNQSGWHFCRRAAHPRNAPIGWSCLQRRQ